MVILILKNASFNWKLLYKKNISFSTKYTELMHRQRKCPRIIRKCRVYWYPTILCYFMLCKPKQTFEKLRDVPPKCFQKRLQLVSGEKEMLSRKKLPMRAKKRKKKNDYFIRIISLMGFLRKKMFQN